MTTAIINCPAISNLSEADLEILSATFPKVTRMQLITMRQLLSNRRESFRAYSEGMVSFDVEATLKAVAFKCSSMASQKLASLVEQGLCLQAIATTPLSIPLTGTERISLRT